MRNKPIPAIFIRDPLTETEIAEIKAYIRHRLDEGVEKFDDGLVAADVVLSGISNQKLVTCKQIKEYRLEINPSSKQKESLEMATRFSPEEKLKMKEFVLSHTGGDDHLTALEIANRINAAKMASRPINQFFVNHIRKSLSNIKKPKKPLIAKAEKQKPARLVKSEPANKSGSIVGAIAALKEKKEEIENAIHSLESLIESGII